MTDPNFTTTINDGALDSEADVSGPEPTFGSSGASEPHPARDAGLRRAVRADLEGGRDWARQRAERARNRIADRPMQTTLYALGAGVLIGLYLRR